MNGQKLYSVSLVDYSGRHINCTDDAEHLGAWIVRTIERIQAAHPSSGYDIRLVNFRETAF